jgi:N-acetylneuraminate lyase
MFLAGAAVGSHGAIGTTFNFFADKYVEARKLFNAGKNEEALAIIHKVNDVTETLVNVGNNVIAASKYVMKLQGFDVLPISREPFSPLTEADMNNIKAVYENTKF